MSRKILIPVVFYLFYLTMLETLALAGTVDLPVTGQTTSYAIDDDGYLQMGVSWPDPRFKDNGDGTVTDNLTGLIWAQDANLAGGTKTWQEALTYVLMMNAGIYENFGHRDWRLPNRKELHSLTDFSQTSPALPSGHPFTNVQAYYWSSTTFAVSPAEKAWYLVMNFGYTDYYYYKTSGTFCYVWPVRSAATGNKAMPWIPLLLLDG